MKSTLKKPFLLELGEFRAFNVARSEAPKAIGGFDHKLADWTPAEWGCAVAGEAGEFCNLLKKIRRGDGVSMRDVADEAGDVLAYLDLACARLDIDLVSAVVKKWDRVSLERGYEKLLAHRVMRFVAPREFILEQAQNALKDGDRRSALVALENIVEILRERGPKKESER